MNAHVDEALIAPVFPIAYAMRVDAPNGAGEFQHDDLAVFNTVEEPEAGDLVCVHPRRGGAVLVVLTFGLGPNTWAKMPYREHPKSEIHALMIGTILGTDRQISIACQDLWAVHKCDGKADPADCAE